MASAEFDSKFQKLFSTMVEIAFEYVGFNKSEVDTVYVYGSMEGGGAFYNVFFRINGKLVFTDEVNSVSKQQHDISDERTFQLLRLGCEYLEEIRNLFKQDGREVPTLMKMIYYPETGKFNNDISYHLRFLNDDELMDADIFDQWFAEVQNSESSLACSVRPSLRSNSYKASGTTLVIQRLFMLMSLLVLKIYLRQNYFFYRLCNDVDTFSVPAIILYKPTSEISPQVLSLLCSTLTSPFFSLNHVQKRF